MYNIEYLISNTIEVTAKKIVDNTIIGGQLKYYKDTDTYVIVSEWWNKIETAIDITTMHPVIEYHRQPTKGEIKFGHGATHYKDFEASIYLNSKGVQKYRLKCPIDGLWYHIDRY